jgi:phosphoglycerate dehydrogenase-like enzyme
MTRIAVLDDWQGIAEAAIDWSAVRAKAELVFLREPTPGTEATVAALAGFDAVLAMRERTRLSAEVIARLPRLKLITFTGARNAAVDTAACTAAGVLVCNTTGARQSYATAELAVGLMIAAARRITQGDAEIRAGRFQERVPAGLELAGRTAGVIGLGNLGSRFARSCLALDMTVLAWSQNLTAERAAEVGVTPVSKEELLRRADVVSLHLVLSPRSQGTLGAAELALMKPGAILINTSRGPLVDQSALLAAVNAGRIFAALDVFDTEPLPAAHPLRGAPNTLLTPHLGYVIADNMAQFYRVSAENLVAWLDGAPIRVLNPEVTPRPA